MIPPDPFTVELQGRAGYETPTPAELAAAVAEIEAGLAGYGTVGPPGEPWMRVLEPIDEGRHSHLLLEEFFPADRFCPRPAAVG